MKFISKILNYIRQKSRETTPNSYQIVGDEQIVKIGKDVSFGGNVTIVASNQVEIGDYTMIAINVLIHTASHNFNNHPMWIERIDRPIKIGTHVWIGASAIILSGVIIEDFAVIAAGSVVIDNVPKGAIVGGNPARIIKYRNIDKLAYAFDLRIRPTAIKEGFKNKYCKEK